MTKRKDPADLKIRARDDMTPVKPKKRGANATPEGRAIRIAKLRASSPGTTKLADIAIANPNRPLTEKQRMFVSEWAKGETILSASIRAGYADSGSVAYRLSKDPAILKIYHLEKALYEASCQMTRKQVMDGLLEGIDMAKQVSEPASVISGWREIGKMCGYYSEQKRTLDINIRGDVTIKNLERMSDTDLLKLIKGEAEDVVYENVIEEGEDE